MEDGWERLGRTLGGSFAARARGVVSPELVLLGSGGERFGTLTPDGADGALLRAGDLEACIGRLADGSYRMTADGEEILSAGPAGSETTLDVRSGDRLYEARIPLLRGHTVARSAGGNEAVRVLSNLTNRRHQATFDPEDPTSLPVAIFLLGRAFILRSRALRAAR